MYSIVLSALLALWQPAQFEIQLDTTTDVVIMLDDQQIKPGQTYATNPLPGPVTVEFVVKYYDDDEIVTKVLQVTLVPGKCTKMKLTIRGPTPLTVKV